MTLGLAGGIQAKASGWVFDSAHQPGLAEPSATQLKDYSRFKNHGTFFADGNPDWVWDGKLWVMSFTGAYAGSYVSLGDDPSLDVTEGITVAVWLKATALDNVDIIMANTNGDSLTKGWGFRWSSGDVLRFFINQLGTNEAYISFSVDSLWHLLVGTYDKTTVKIYVDGVKGTDDTYSSSIDYTTATGTTLGSAVRGNSNYKMTGFLALPRIGQRILSATKLGSGDGSIFKAERGLFGV